MLIISLPTKSAGFSLIEVLVAIIVMSIGILGMLGLQISSMATNQGAYYRSQATILVADMADRMRANSSSAASYSSFDSESPPSDPACSAAGCTSAEMVIHDLRQWSNYFTDTDDYIDFIPLLPDGQGTITTVDGNYRITVSWQVMDWNDDGSEEQGEEERSVSLDISL